MIKSMLIDPSKCIGCRSCQMACKQWNQLPAEKTGFTGTYENPPGFSPLTWTKIVFNEYEVNSEIKWNFTKQGCMHCYDAACMTVCPADAIYRTNYGTIAVDVNKCIGCNYCAKNCPFGVISFDRKTNVATKCTFCVDRIDNGLQPACAAACPTGAISYDSRSVVLAAANQRVVKLREQGFNNANIYGDEELEGTGMVYVLADKPEYYGLPNHPEVPFSARLWGVMFKPLRFFIVLLMALGLWVNKSQSKDVQSVSDKKSKAVTNEQEVIEYLDE